MHRCNLLLRMFFACTMDIDIEGMSLPHAKEDAAVVCEYIISCLPYVPEDT